MNISSRCEYACRAVIELARLSSMSQPTTIEAIARKRGIPEKFLVQILLQLKRAGIVRSVRGVHGGYLLGRMPESITLLDIVQAVDGPVLRPLPVRDEGSADLAPTWREVAAGIENVLREVTVRTILDRASASTMYFI
ncbi:MAG TPA: Rrf2 family transcriptional regulator [Candidatus Hydrogenedentes bacterium]|nr:Rrf2 family transcriptional regulator [Candidatus Hydrogenedentota bacterium]HOT50068.1 Rrf2 family transcriptional regulator [Candidatus Hydrogenedentota bacterium]HOV75569.1 Rrf2 family transcriptional regulator [Candidatus Hydrogenedentota bacterium]HPC17737.1 Rrf2 family transcriptional regulator [Candidatus Hydrogenedentota bacterium]HRT20125.1 Rrf2 family transcriptional regulator [Candidatus Hydrogenedentota bacterium]